MTDAPIRSQARSYALGMLLIVYVFNFIDRQIISILQEPIKAEFGLADWQLGLMTGVAFAIFYTALGLPIARLADRGVPRVRIISVALALWSLATAICGAAQNFVQLLLARLAVGVGEAGCSPSALSIIADLYRREERGFAMGVYALGIPIGSMLGLMFGGWIADALGWRAAVALVGLPGVALAGLFAMTVREPIRATVARNVELPLRNTLAVMLKKPAYRQLLVGGSIASVVSAGVALWFPPFFMRSHGMTIAEVGFSWGLVAGAAGVVGGLGGGWLIDRLGKRDPRMALYLPAAALLVAFPFFIAALTAHSAHAALLYLILPIAMNSAWLASFMALGQSLSPLSMRATIAAFGALVTNLVGIGAGPLMLGAASDFFAAQTGSAAEGLRWALMIAGGGYLWAAAHFFLAAKTLTDDLEIEIN